MRVLVGMGGLVAAATLAYAADLTTPATAAPPDAAPTWTGFYVGLESGVVSGSSNQIAGGPKGVGPISPGYTVTGGLVGGTAGVNWQTGSNLALGLEADLAWADVAGLANEMAPFVFGAAVETREHWFGTGRGRLGWTTSDGIMFYATGGVAGAIVEAEVMTPTIPLVTDSQYRWGGIYGGGVEAKIDPNWSLKLEYLQVQFQSTRYFVNPPAGISTRSDVQLFNEILRFGIDYAFH